MMEKAIEKLNLNLFFYFPNWVSVNTINPDIAKQQIYINPDKIYITVFKKCSKKRLVFFENFLYRNKW